MIYGTYLIYYFHMDCDRSGNDSIDSQLLPQRSRSRERPSSAIARCLYHITPAFINLLSHFSLALMATGVPPSALKRLRSELKQLLADPMEDIVAKPNPSNILEWFYVLRGSKNSPFEHGEYFGSLIFP